MKEGGKSRRNPRGRVGWVCFKSAQDSWAKEGGARVRNGRSGGRPICADSSGYWRPSSAAILNEGERGGREVKNREDREESRVGAFHSTEQ